MSSRHRDERGALAAVFALLLGFVLLPLGAAVVDVGFWYTNAKRAQTTADAAALAGASQIPSGQGAVDAEARRYVARNMPGAEVVLVEYPNADGLDPAREVEVVVEHPAPTFFGRAFGIFGVSSTRRAVAERLEDPGNLAIFAHGADCDSDGSLTIDASDVFVNGRVHANGLFRVAGDDVWVAEATLNRPNCPSSIDEEADPVQFGGDTPPPWCGPQCRLPNDHVFEEWPAWWVPQDFGWLTGCTYWGSKIRIVSDKVVIHDERDTGATRELAFGNGHVPTGTYCARESFIVDGDDLHGTITGLALEVSVEGHGHDFTPHRNGVFLFRVPNASLMADDDGLAPTGAPITCDTSRTTELRLGGGDHAWRGAIFNPCGRVSVDVGGSSAAAPALTGAIVAEQVRIAGGPFHMVGSDDFSGTVELNLVE